VTDANGMVSSASTRLNIFPEKQVPGNAVERKLLTSFENARLVKTKYVSDNEIYMIYADSTNYNIARWNGNALSVIDTHPTQGQINEAFFVYKNSNEYFVVFNERGSGYYSSYYRPTKVFKYSNGVRIGEKTIPWQWGSMEGQFSSAIYYEGKIFLVGNSRDYFASVLTVDPVTLNYSEVFRRAAVGYYGWMQSRLHLVNDTLYFSYCQNTGYNDSPVLITFAKWTGSSFTVLADTNGPSISGYGIQPYVAAVENDRRFYLVTNGKNTFDLPYSMVRFEQIDIENGSYISSSINSLPFSQNRVGIVSWDHEGHWRICMSLAEKTYALSFFDYETSSITSMFENLQYDEGYHDPIWFIGDGTSNRLVYSVMSGNTCEVWMIKR
jgi:hypothetical protein